MSTVRFTTFARTKPPLPFVEQVVGVFRGQEPKISTQALAKGLESDPVLKILAEDLAKLGFAVEVGKSRGRKISRPVFYGENGQPTLLYEIDAYHQV